jgi:lipopolysaccharide heptosyltransferase II
MRWDVGADERVDERWARAERVLAVRLDSMGDVLMTTPAIRAVKESRPTRNVTMLTSTAGADIARLVPEIDDVIVYDAPWMKATARREGADADRAMIELLRRERFDAAIVFTVYSQSPLPAATLCYLADIPLRLAQCRERAYQLLTDGVPEFEPERGTRHEVRRQLDLVASVGHRTNDERLSARIGPGAVARVRTLLDFRGVDIDRPWAVLHPGATAPARRYPANSFAEAASRLSIDHGWTIALIGGPGDEALVSEVRDLTRAPTVSLGTSLDVEELGALLSLAPVLIANNSGPVHLAAAVGTSVVDLYALTNPQHAPWGVPNRVLNRDVPCRFCYASTCPQRHHKCLRFVPTDDVVDAAIELVGSTAPASRRSRGYVPSAR